MASWEVELFGMCPTYWYLWNYDREEVEARGKARGPECGKNCLFYQMPNLLLKLNRYWK